MTPILQDLPFQSGDEVAVLINGLGATPKEELYILYAAFINCSVRSESMSTSAMWASSPRRWRWRELRFRSCGWMTN